MIQNKNDKLTQIKLAEVERQLNVSEAISGPFLIQQPLKTIHFTLRQLELIDYDDLYKAAADRSIWEQHPVKDRHTVEGFANYWRIIYSMPGSLAIIDNKNNELVGTSSFYEYDQSKKEVTIGYTFLKKDYWGGSFNFEIKRVMINFAFRYVDKVNFYVGSENIRSRTALKKIGAVKIKEFEKENPHGGIVINVVYQIDQNKPICRKAHIEDIPQINKIMEKTFCQFPQLENLFAKWILNPDCSVYVAELKQELIGVSTCALKLDNDLSKYKSFGPKAIDLLNEKKLASVVNLVILPDYRNQKIGTKLALSHIDWLEKNSCDLVFGTSWVNGTAKDSSHIYLNAGFQKIAESKTFLLGQMQDGAICSICKTNECRCNSMLVVADLKKLIENLGNISTVE